MASVGSLSMAPVKGLRLTHPRSVIADHDGIQGDRRFIIVGDDDRYRSQTTEPGLVRVVVDYDAGREWLSLSFPDGSRIDGPAHESGRATAIPWGDRQLTVRPVAARFGEALGAHLGYPVRLVRALEPTRSASHAVTLVSGASVERLAEGLGRSRPLGTDRLRMTVTLEGCDAFEEDRWVGRQVRLGEVLVEVTGPTPRCVQTTRDPATGERDVDLLERILAVRGRSATGSLDLGVYASVVQPGTLSVGDRVEPAG